MDSMDAEDDQLFSLQDVDASLYSVGGATETEPMSDDDDNELNTSIASLTTIPPTPAKEQ